MITNRIPVRPRLSKAFIIKAFLVWVLFIPFAFINGFARELLYKPVAGELVAHQISCFLASIGFFVLAYFMLRQRIYDVNDKALWVVGGIWVFMTILFEFGLGRANDTSWDRLLNDYNILKGRLWMLVLLTIFLTPAFIRRISKHNIRPKGIVPVTR